MVSTSLYNNLSQVVYCKTINFCGLNFQVLVFWNYFGILNFRILLFAELSHTLKNSIFAPVIVANLPRLQNKVQ